MSATGEKSFKWSGEKVECYNEALLNENCDFYTSFVKNDEQYSPGDFAIYNKTGRPSDNRVCRFYCMYESKDQGPASTKRRALVKWYTWAIDVREKFDKSRIAFDEQSEIVEDHDDADVVVHLQYVRKKCRVMYATDEDPLDILDQMDLDREVYFLCRYKLTRARLELVMSENNIAKAEGDAVLELAASAIGSASFGSASFGDQTHDSTQETMIYDLSQEGVTYDLTQEDVTYDLTQEDKTPAKHDRSVKNKRKSVLQPISLNSDTDDNLRSSYKNGSPHKVRSPKNPLKTIKLSPKSKSPSWKKNTSNENTSNKNDSNKNDSNKNTSNKNDSNKNDSNKNTSNKNDSNKNDSNKNDSNKNDSNKNTPNKNTPNKNTPNRKEAVRRNLNESFSKSFNTSTGTPILNYSIIKSSTESLSDSPVDVEGDGDGKSRSANKPIKLKLRISDKEKKKILSVDKYDSDTPTLAHKMLNKEYTYQEYEHSDSSLTCGPTRRSHRAVQRKSYADFISPVKGRGCRISSDSAFSGVSEISSREKGVTLKGETLKGETQKGETLKGETQKGETLKGETLKRETSKGATPKKGITPKKKVPRIPATSESETDDEPTNLRRSTRTPQSTRSKRNVPRKRYNEECDLNISYYLDSPNVRRSTRIPAGIACRSARKSILKIGNDISTPKKTVKYLDEVAEQLLSPQSKVKSALENIDACTPKSTRKSLMKNTPMRNTPIKDTPIKDTPTKHTPIKNTPIKNTPKENSPTKHTPMKDTPGRRAKLIREGLITPTMKSRDKAVKSCDTPLTKARSQLHVSFVPKAMPCREKEFADIYGFLEGKLYDGCGGCMYISGVPGTGKTATVTEVVRRLQEAVDDEDLPSFDYVNINGMRLTEPRQSYVEILRQLTGKTVAWEQAQSILEAKFTKNGATGKHSTDGKESKGKNSIASGKNSKAPGKNSKTKGPSTGKNSPLPVVLVVDELDILCTKRQDVVYNLLDWPTKASAQLIVITIANTMDLPERLLMGRVTSRLGLTRLTFQAYTHKQLQEIVTKRLTGTDAFNPDAIQLVARKVASVSGDARRALDICRRAAEIAEAEGPQTLVSMTHVNEALNAMITQPKVQAIKRCSRLEQLVLQAIVAEVERTGVEETNFMDVYTMLGSVAALDGFQMVSTTVSLAAVSRLGACRLLLTDQKSHDMDQRLILNVSPDDVYYALRED